MFDPFTILEVPPSADDATVKKAYLKKVQLCPPERDPQRFQQIRQAFELIETKYKRVDYQLFYTTDIDMTQLISTAMESTATDTQRPTSQQVLDALSVC